jgi:hypothetical protein
MPSVLRNSTALRLAFSAVAPAHAPLAFEVAAIKPLPAITLGARTVPRAMFHYVYT